MTIVPIVVGAFDTVSIKETGGIGSWRTSGAHPNDSIIENDQNIVKSSGDLKRLALTQTPVKDHQVTLM